MNQREQTLSGWGNFSQTKATVMYPSNDKEIGKANQKDCVIPRGLGRSYGDQATNKDRFVIDMNGFNHFLSFDEKEGVVECEAGVALDDIVACFAPKGWFLMITPGTKYVTIGGAIANDVHGKAHHVDGSFASCVLDFKILLSDGTVMHASREENDDLFWANFGGLGLLGTILSARIKLRKIETTFFKTKAIEIKNLDHLFDALDDCDKEYNYSVASLDSFAKGEKLGKGVLVVGNHVKLDELPAKLRKEPLLISGKPKLNLPIFLPNFTLNTFTVWILNKLIYMIQKSGDEFAHYESFFYPLDMADNWNRAYGKKGFIQYQFVVPFDHGRENIKKILKAITESGCTPFLNVLKKFGNGNRFLSFPMEGYTFAIDFPITKKLKPFTKKLDRMVLDAGGRIYMGKDSFLDEETFKSMYPAYKEWLSIVKKYNPESRFCSDLSRRLGIGREL